jgi:magnesium transporter
VPSGFAGSRATARVAKARLDETVADARMRLLGPGHETVSELVVLDGGRFVGLIPIVRLLDADAEMPLDQLTDGDAPVVSPDDGPERITGALHGAACSSVAVVDADGGFVGLIHPRQIQTMLLTEHDEDIARLGGYLASTDRARSAAEETVRRRLLHRLPWLLIGLIGAMASAVLVGAFETELDKQVLLAFFVPGVVYMADAVGTQTEAVLIRGLAVGVSIRDVALREFGTGAVVGLVVAAAFIPFAWLGWGDPDVALAVGLALFASCGIATVVAMLLPWAFQRFGRDPAFGSGPLATVIQDLLSIAVYFAVALPLAT